MRRHRKLIIRPSLDLVTSSMELSQGSAVVIVKRTGAIAAAGVNPSAVHDREMKRMVDEKNERFGRVFGKHDRSRDSCLAIDASRFHVWRPHPDCQADSTLRHQRARIKHGAFQEGGAR